MPMLDIFIPENALAPSAETALIQRLTDLLLVHEGADPKNPAARALAWVFLHRPAAVFVAGSMAADPHYRVVASVPQGQFDDERRAAVVKAATDAILDAEEGSRPRNPARVWVFANEVLDGTWGADGRVHRLADIAGKVLGDAEKGRLYAQRRLAQRGHPA
jgi:phenylpyruvate tautomerase PptA (4-oxalocrotonate tautomerase family)